MKSTKSRTVNTFIIGTFVSLYLLVSIISTIHVVDFFRLSNPEWLAISLAVGFELGAAASLAALITLDKMNKTIVWGLFILITGMQMQGNMYYAYTNIKDYQGWVELFNLVEWEPISQKRLLAGVSGAILPLVALGFIKSLVDYIKPEDALEQPRVEDLEVLHEEVNVEEQVESMRNVVESYDDLQEEMDEWERASLEDFIDEETYDQAYNDGGNENPQPEDEQYQEGTKDLYVAPGQTNTAISYYSNAELDMDNDRLPFDYSEPNPGSGADLTAAWKPKPFNNGSTSGRIGPTKYGW